MGFVDVVMVGCVSLYDLVVVVLGNLIWILMFLLMIGILFVIMVKVV